MIEYKKLIIGASWFLLAQSLSWYQTNGQFISTWMKENPILLSLMMRIPVGVGYIYGTENIVAAFGGQSLWASRIFGFVTGIFTFSILTYLNMKEGINIKTAVLLALGTIIVILQVFWQIEE